ncbi:MAG TPA: arylesterase [Methylomirabilota bacterium]|jgi:acyl-CoA thioesterase-1
MRALLGGLLLLVQVVAACSTGPPASAGEEPVVLAFGDSLTSGLGVPADQTYPAQLAARLQREGYDYRVVNAGVSGDTSAGGLRRVDWALRLRPEVVIVELGVNDALRGQKLASVRDNLEQIVARFQAAGARVLIAGMRLPPNYGDPYAAEFFRLYGDVARARNAPLMPFFLDGVGAVPRLNQSDGIHPTAEGYAIVVDRLWPHLVPLLRK